MGVKFQIFSTNSIRGRTPVVVAAFNYYTHHSEAPNRSQDEVAVRSKVFALEATVSRFSSSGSLFCYSDIKH